MAHGFHLALPRDHSVARALGNHLWCQRLDLGQPCARQVTRVLSGLIPVFIYDSLEKWVLPIGHSRDILFYAQFYQLSVF